MLPDFLRKSQVAFLQVKIHSAGKKLIVSGSRERLNAETCKKKCAGESAASLDTYIRRGHKAVGHPIEPRSPASDAPRSSSYSVCSVYVYNTQLPVNERLDFLLCLFPSIAATATVVVVSPLENQV